jgi:inosose dehydratase
MKLTRRALLATVAATTAAPLRERLLAQGYIFVQDAQRRKTKPVEEVDRICATIAAAGFRSVELMSEFFEPGARGRTIDAVRKHGLTVPIVYVGGAMHEPGAASSTRAKALEIASAARDAGTVAINTNPSPKPKRERKTDAELATQAKSLNRLGQALAKSGTKLLYHTHDPEMAEDAREWRYVLQKTDEALVSLCMDTHWIYRGGQNPVTLLSEAGKRTASLHLRNSKDGIWSETFGEGDVNYSDIADVLKRIGIEPYLVVELAYEKGTEASWNLEDALRRSREYARKVFEV